MSGASNILGGQSDQGLSSILAQLNALLTPTEQLPGNQNPYSVLLAQPSGAVRATPAATPSAPATSTPQSSSWSSLLQGAANPNSPISKLVQSLLGPSLASYGSGAAANSAVSAALGNVGAQTAPESASIQAGNDAALNAMDGGSAGAGAGLLSLEGLGSGAAANAAVAGELGSVGAQTAGEAAAIQAANDAALGGAAAGGGAGAGSGAAASGALGAGAGAAASIGIAALPALLAAYVPDSAELTPQKIAQMESGVSAATQANGGPIGAAYTQNPNGTLNQAHYQTLNDLMTLEYENPEEFAKAGGTGPITQYLQSMGYSPINWNAVQANPNISQARGNTSGKQL